MAKKTKLNKQFAAAAVGTVLIVGVGGAVSFKLYRDTYRPGQLKAEGRELMLKGDYVGAHNRFSRAGQRLATDVEFLGWFYEMTMRQTSFKELALRDARSQLETILVTAPNDVPMLIERLRLELTLIDPDGLEQASPEQATRLAEWSEKVLAAQPDEPVAIRGLALSRTLPLLKQNTSVTASEVQPAIDALAATLQATPDHPDVAYYYALAMTRLREVLVRDRTVAATGDDDRVRGMVADLDGRVESLLNAAADEARPAAYRASAYRRAYMIDHAMLATRMIADKAQATRTAERRLASLAAAASVVPTASELYLPTRLEQAALLGLTNKNEEAEKILRETIAGRPLQWQPRIALAEFLAERGRTADALEAVGADLKPSTDLYGIDGYQFLAQSREVPLRRAYVRLQNLGSVAPEAREKEIAAAQGDYDLSMGDGKIPESTPYALMVKAALQEVRLDRTGAVQTLTRALEGGGVNDRLRLRVQQQLVTLNLALNQPGAASAVLEQMLRGSPDLNTVMRLIDLRIKNGETDQARALLAQVRRTQPDNVVLQAAEIKLMADPARQREALAKFPEDAPHTRNFKLQLAAETKDEATVRRLADAALKAEPGALDVSLMYGSYLRSNGKPEEAVAIFTAALERNPGNRNLEILIKDTQATTPAEREQVVKEAITDPYRRALFEAEQARVRGDLPAYLAGLERAEPLDAGKDGTATERLFLYYLAVGEHDRAGQALDRLGTMPRDPAVVRAHRVRLALGKRQLDDAQAQADALVAELPNSAPGWVVKGLVHQAREQWGQGIDAFETALAGQPENVEALRGLVESADRAGRADVLKRYIDVGLRVTKNDEFFTEWAQRYEVGFGDPTATIEPRLKRRDAAPNDPGRWVLLAQSYLASARAKEKAGDRAAAAGYRANAMTTYTEGGAKFPDLAGFPIEAANLVAATGDVAGATARVDAMEANPKFAADPNVQALRADFYAANGKPERAVQLLQAQADAKSATEPMLLKLASLLANADDAAGALRTLEAAQDTPANRELRMNILVASNRLDEAGAMTEAALAKERSVPNLLMGSIVRGRKGDAAGALKLCDEAVAASPENPAARFTRVRLALAERPLRNNDVIADLQVVRKNAPGNVDARLLLADRLQALGRSAEALSELESAQREFPGSVPVTTQLVQAYGAEAPVRFARIEQVITEAKRAGLDADPQLLTLESSVAERKGDMKRAVQAAGEAMKARPGDVAIVRALIGVLGRAGLNAEVIVELDRIQKSNAALYWTYLARGSALHRLKRDAEAAKEYDRAIGIASSLAQGGPQAVDDVVNTYAAEYGAEAAAGWVRAKLPDDLNTKLLAMRVLVVGGKTDQAIAAGEALLPQAEQLPANVRAQVLSVLGTAYLSTSPPRADKAYDVFTKLNALEPENMMTLNNLAYAMTLEGSGASMQDAVVIAKQAADLSERNATPNAYILDTYGWTLVQSGKVEEGVAVLRRALEVQPLAEADYHIGEALILQNQKDAALQSLQNALAKLDRAKQNGGPSDSVLEGRVKGAIRRAEALAAG